MIWMIAAAIAGTWGPLEPVPSWGPIAVPAGEALRFEGEAVVVRDASGRPVPLRATPEGWILLASASSRVVAVEGARGVRRVDGLRGPSWERWETEMWRALWRGEPLPAPPDAPGSVSASIAARRAAVADPAVVALGALHDVSAHRPLIGVAHRSLPPEQGAATPGAPARFPVAGPGTAVVRVLPRGVDGVLRHTVRIGLDGRPQATHVVASAGTSPRSVRVWVPPGEHALSVAVPEAPAVVTVEHHRLRRRITGAGLVPERALSGLDAAEYGWLLGDRRPEAFRPFVDEAGAVGALARARVVASSPDPDEVVRVATAHGGPDGPVAAAVLARAAELPAELVRAAVDRIPNPDVEAVARWLDARPGLRPRGIALRHAATPEVPVAPAPSTSAPAAATLHTAWQPLSPEGAPADWFLDDDGPGATVLSVDPDHPATVTLPDPGDGRAPILRLRAHERAVYRLDDVVYDAGPGRLDVALPPGDHRLTVEAGAVVILDPERAVGGVPTRSWAAHRLPVAFPLPDPGVAAALVVRVDATALAAFDTGRVVRLDPGTHALTAGPYETALTLLGDGHGAAAMRLDRDAVGHDDPVATDRAMSRLADLTRRVDAGDEDARLDRARLLAALGQLTFARRDLDALSTHPRLARAAARVPLAAAVPSAAVPGPRTVEAARARTGATGPVTPDALEAEGLWGLAAEAWIDAGEPVRAVAAALRSDDPDAIARSTARLSFSGLTRVDRSAGLVEVTQHAAPDDAPREHARVRDALFAGPWDPTEALTLRGRLDDRIRFTGSALALGLFCRDEDGPGRPCRARVRVDGALHEVAVPDGQVRHLRRDLPPGAHEVEILAPEPGRALSVRVVRDGALLPPRITRSAVRATPEQPVETLVAGGAVVRIEALRGQGTADAGGRAVPVSPGAPAWLPLTEPGAHAIRVTGDVDLLLYRGVPRVEAPEPPASTSSFSGPDIADLFDRFAPVQAPLATAGDLGSLRVGLSGLRDDATRVLGAWHAAELTVEAFRRDDAAWLRGGVWTRLPVPAGGLFAERGWTWDGGFVSARGDAALTEGAQRLEGRVVARHDLPLTPDTRARLQGSLSGRNRPHHPPPGPVDPRVWSVWDHLHPVTWALTPSVVFRPFRDVRLELGGRLAGGPGEVVDRLGPEASAHLLVDRTVVGVDGALSFDDGRVDERVGVVVDHAVWTGADRQVTGWGRASWSAAGLDASAGVRVLLSPRRGLRDLPPDLERFRTAREAP